MTLREEILDSLKMQGNWSTFSITAVITLIGFALNVDKTIPEMYLLPFAVLVLAASKVSNYKRNITTKAAYMIAWLECEDGIMWETHLNRFREKDAQRRTRVQKILRILETQEFTVMGGICIMLFAGILYLKKLCNTRYFVEMGICIVALVVIILLSTDYWNLNVQEVDDLVDTWSDIIEGTRTKTTDEECPHL